MTMTFYSSWILVIHHHWMRLLPCTKFEGASKAMHGISRNLAVFRVKCRVPSDTCCHLYCEVSVIEVAKLPPELCPDCKLPFDNGCWAKVTLACWRYLITLMLLHVFICAGLCWKSSGATQRLRLTMTILSIIRWILVSSLHQVTMSQRECAQNSRKLGCGVSRAQGTDHLTPAVCSAKLNSLRWCTGGQNYIWFFVAIWRHFKPKI